MHRFSDLDGGCSHRHDGTHPSDKVIGLYYIDVGCELIYLVLHGCVAFFGGMALRIGCHSLTFIVFSGRALARP